MTRREAHIEAPLTHICYEGHFPGRPILPGVLLIELIVEALGRGAPRAIPQVKFHHALVPGDGCTVRFEGEGARVSFRCERAAAGGTEIVADGVLMFGSAA
jgi:3-hydroxymyristoyl/3-hydroxydecanoyl-(acyl carrier protein) dehydratase